MINARRSAAVAILIAVAGTSVGCEGLRRKFVRKRKVERTTEPIFALEHEYRPEFPPDVRYQAHVAYWKAAHGDLLEGLTQATQARRMRAVRQAIKELRAMQALVADAQAQGLGRLLEEMAALERQVEDPVLDPPRLAVMRSTIESLRRRIDAGYDFHAVKAHVKSDTPTDAAPTH